MEDKTPTPKTAPPAAYNPTRIENYYDQVHKASWVRRAAGIFAGATLGVLFGGAIGTVAAFLPVILGTAALGSMTVGGVTAVAGVYAAFGAFMGTTVATSVGESAGAVAGGLAVREHQEDTAKAQQPVIATQPTKDAGPSGPKYFSWRPAAFFGGLCSAFGAATTWAGLSVAGGEAVISGAATLFGGVTGPAMIPAAAIMFGLLGTTFGFKVGRMSNQLSNFYTKILTDDFWKKKQPVPEVAAPAPVPEKAPTLHEPQPEATPQKVFATQPKQVTPEAVLAERATAQEAAMLPSR